MALKVGRIPFANLYPIFYTLEHEFDCSEYKFIDGVPSALNRMLRTGEIDLSPSSSIEYLRHEDQYTIIKGHSISSTGPVKSIILFSKEPLERLNNKTVLVSAQSETSAALLKIIFEKFLQIKSDLRTAVLNYGSLSLVSDPYLLIGDDAMKAVKSYTKSDGPQSLHIYDLGEIWYKYTGLPFIFALWIVRNECLLEKKDLLERFIRDLDKAKELALKGLKKIASKYPEKDILTADELVSYWQKNISYDFSEEHKKGLSLFKKLSAELCLLNR